MYYNYNIITLLYIAIPVPIVVVQIVTFYTFGCICCIIRHFQCMYDISVKYYYILPYILLYRFNYYFYYAHPTLSSPCQKTIKT